MTREASRLGVVDLPRRLLADLGALDIDKIDIVRSGVDHCPEEHLSRREVNRGRERVKQGIFTE